MLFLLSVSQVHLRLKFVRKAVALAALLVSSCLVAGCHSRSGTTETQEAETVLRIGFPQITGRDPLRGMEQASSLLSLEGLTVNSRDGRVTPKLAERWAVSADGLTVTFTLRQHAKFHDGTPVDATAVKRSLDESLASLTDRSFQPGLEDVVAIEVAGPGEVVVRLRNRSTFLLDDLSMPIQKRRQGSLPVATGPFIATDVSIEGISMNAFPEYYLGAPQIRRVIWRPYPALRTAWAGMMRGEIDFLYEVSQEAVEFVEDESSVSTSAFLRPYVLGVVFNSGRKPFIDRRVRQALNFAVDRRAMVAQALRGHGTLASTPIWPAHWAFQQNISGFEYDPGRASALLSTIHVPSTAKGSQAAGRSAELRFSCLLIEGLPHWERMALMVQKQFSEIGVDMKLEAVSATAFNQRVARGDFEAIFVEIVGGYSMSKPFVFWHSESSQNSFGYSNRAVDELLEAIRRAPDDESYRIAAGRLQESMVADPPGVFLAWGQIARVVSRRFQTPNEPNRDVLQTMAAWRLASTVPKATH